MHVAARISIESHKCVVPLPLSVLVAMDERKSLLNRKYHPAFDSPDSDIVLHSPQGTCYWVLSSVLAPSVSML